MRVNYVVGVFEDVAIAFFTLAKRRFDLFAFLNLLDQHLVGCGELCGALFDASLELCADLAKLVQIVSGSVIDCRHRCVKRSDLWRVDLTWARSTGEKGQRTHYKCVQPDRA